jgi:hypothetical protein
MMRSTGWVWEDLCLEACEEEIKVAFRALALAAAMEGWEAAKKDLVWTHVKIPSAAILVLSGKIERLGEPDVQADG